MAKDTEEGAFDAPQFIEEFCQGNLRAELNKAVKELYRHVQMFDDAFEAACSKAGENTGLPLFYGTPES